MQPFGPAGLTRSSNPVMREKKELNRCFVNSLGAATLKTKNWNKLRQSWRKLRKVDSLLRQIFRVASIAARLQRSQLKLTEEKEQGREVMEREERRERTRMERG